MAKTKAKETTGKEEGKGTDGPENRSQAITALFEEKGWDAKPSDIVEEGKRRFKDFDWSGDNITTIVAGIKSKRKKATEGGGGTDTKGGGGQAAAQTTTGGQTRLFNRQQPAPAQTGGRSPLVTGTEIAPAGDLAYVLNMMAQIKPLVETQGKDRAKEAVIRMIDLL